MNNPAVVIPTTVPYNTTSSTYTPAVGNFGTTSYIKKTSSGNYNSPVVGTTATGYNPVLGASSSTYTPVMATGAPVVGTTTYTTPVLGNVNRGTQ